MISSLEQLYAIVRVVFFVQFVIGVLSVMCTRHFCNIAIVCNCVIYRCIIKCVWAKGCIEIYTPNWMAYHCQCWRHLHVFIPAGVRKVAENQHRLILQIILFAFR